MRKIALCLSSLLLAFNFGACWADEYDDIPVKYDPKIYKLYDGAYLTSKKEVRYDKPRIVIQIVYPYLFNQDEYGIETSEVDDSLADFNQNVSDIIEQQKQIYQNRVHEYRGDQSLLPKSALKNNLYIDYDSSFIRSGKHRLLSVRFSIQGYIAGMAHPYHQHVVLNYDLDHAQILDLNDLFKSDSDNLQLFSQYSQFILSKRLQNKEMVVAGTLPTANSFKLWNIKANGILITFEEYQVAPYVDGTQTVLIPFILLKNKVSSQSPIAGCIKNKNSCRYSNILTGGFIDEAVNLRHGAFNPILSSLQ